MTFIDANYVRYRISRIGTSPPPGALRRDAKGISTYHSAQSAWLVPDTYAVEVRSAETGGSISTLMPQPSSENGWIGPQAKSIIHCDRSLHQELIDTNPHANNPLFDNDAEEILASEEPLNKYHQADPFSYRLTPHAYAGTLSEPDLSLIHI